MAFRPRQATRYYGYGYKFWIYPSAPRRFSLLGVFGQSIFVDPGTRLALIITAVQKDATGRNDGFPVERDALWRGILGRHGAKW